MTQDVERPGGLPWLRLAALGTMAWFAAAAAPSPARAQSSDYFGPIGPEFVVNQFTNYNQYWVRASIHPDGSRIAFSFNAGQDPFARVFDATGSPLTGNLGCTPSLNIGIQDEAEVSISFGGRILVAWSERHGYDGEQMGIFGRIFDSSGVPQGGEFQINEVWQASQWRPLIEPRPAGGWAVAWSGDWDGDAVFRLVNEDGSFASGDVAVNTFDNGGQTDTCLAIAPDGSMFMVFVDYSGHGGIGSGRNLWGRRFDANGNALQADFPINSAGYVNGDQREPRLAADGAGNYILTWEDDSADGSSWGIFARRFDPNGAPLGLEFQVNENTTGPQRGPRVATDSAGYSVITWTDWFGPDANVMARRYDPSGNPTAGDFRVHEVIAGDQIGSSVDVTPAGDLVVFSYEGPGNQKDAYGRIYTTILPPTVYCTAKVNSEGCTPAVSSSGTPSLTGADDFHVAAAQVLNNKSGILFYGFDETSLPFGGGLRCVRAPVSRTPLQDSGGNPPPNDCSGSYDFHFSQAFLAARGLTAGTAVYCQFWSRDPAFPHPQSVGLTDALKFALRP